MEQKKLIKELKKFKKELKEKHKIKKMILFGSRAKGIIRDDNDVDLILVGDFKEKTNRKRVPKIHFKWPLDLPVDILCYTEEEFNKLKNKKSIIKEAISYGIEI